MSAAQTNPLVGVIMGSKNDYAVMRAAVEMLREFGVPHEARIVSAHRTPDRMFSYADAAATRGLRVIIAGAGGAAHLPGMVAARTVLPVLGVPIAATALQGIDSLLSIVQMPKGIPVRTLAIGAAGAANAGLLAVQILATTDPVLQAKLIAWRAARRDEVLAQTLEDRQRRGVQLEQCLIPDACFPARPSASLAAGSLAVSPRWPRAPWAIASTCWTPTPAVPRASSSTSAWRPTGPTPARPRAWPAAATWSRWRLSRFRSPA